MDIGYKYIKPAATNMTRVHDKKHAKKKLNETCTCAVPVSSPTMRLTKQSNYKNVMYIALSSRNFSTKGFSFFTFFVIPGVQKVLSNQVTPYSFITANVSKFCETFS